MNFVVYSRLGSTGLPLCPLGGLISYSARAREMHRKMNVFANLMPGHILAQSQA